MNLKRAHLTFIPLALLAAAGIAFFVTSPGGRTRKIERALSEAGRCTQDADCAILTAPCPFGCYVGVRADEKDRLQSLMADHQSSCVYECAQALGVSCVSGHCEVRTTDSDPEPPQRATMSGTYGCLKPKDPTVTGTSECLAGFTADGGATYGLDFAPMSSIPPELQAGDRFSASGVIVPIERLSADHWRRYGAVGIFSVTDGVTRLPGISP